MLWSPSPVAPLNHVHVAGVDQFCCRQGLFCLPGPQAARLRSVERIPVCRMGVRCARIGLSHCLLFPREEVDGQLDTDAVAHEVPNTSRRIIAMGWSRDYHLIALRGPTQNGQQVNVAEVNGDRRLSELYGRSVGSRCEDPGGRAARDVSCSPSPSPRRRAARLHRLDRPVPGHGP